MRELPRHNLTRSRARVNPEVGLVTVTDGGRAVDGTDKEEVAYGVNLSRRSCDCKGWVQWGTCKHLAAAGGIFVDRGVSPGRLRIAGTWPAQECGR
jgi:hypothetical protein